MDSALGRIEKPSGIADVRLHRTFPSPARLLQPDGASRIHGTRNANADPRVGRSTRTMRG
jgi:hypothetical protein